MNPVILALLSDVGISDQEISNLTGISLGTVQSELTAGVASGEAYLNGGLYYVGSQPWENPAADGALLRPFFCKNLMDQGVDKAVVDAGYIDTIYASIGALPSPPPTGANTPAYAVVNDGDPLGVKFMYWDYQGGSVWVATQCPFTNPILQEGHIIEQQPGNGAGTNNWLFSMGCEVQIVADCSLTEMTMKVGGSGLNHSWAIRRSTVTGASAPSLNTYTDIIASGTHVQSSVNTWESVGSFSPISLTANQWVAPMAYIGLGQGQSGNIATLRNAGSLLETFARLNAGLFVSVGGSNPGSNPLPTSRQTSVIYGVTSVKLEAP